MRIGTCKGTFYLVCKLLAEELTENFQAHNSPSVIETSYSLDAKQPKKTKYSDSYVSDRMNVVQFLLLVVKHG